MGAKTQLKVKVRGCQVFTEDCALMMPVRYDAYDYAVYEFRPVSPHLASGFLVTAWLPTPSGLCPHLRGISAQAPTGLGARAFTAFRSERGLNNAYFI